MGSDGNRNPGASEGIIGAKLREFRKAGKLLHLEAIGSRQPKLHGSTGYSISARIRLEQG